MPADLPVSDDIARFFAVAINTIVVGDDRVDETVKAVVEAARTGKIGDGKVFIYDVVDAVRIRNSETGESAL